MILVLLTALLRQPPPSCSPRTRSGGTSVVSLSTFKTKPTNFLTLSYESDIDGEFVIDPSIRLPRSFLPSPRSSLPSSHSFLSSSHSFLPSPRSFLLSSRSFLSSLGEGNKDRKNLSLMSEHSINAEIWLLGSSSREKATCLRKLRRTIIALNSGAEIDAKVVCLFHFTLLGYCADTRLACFRRYSPVFAEGACLEVSEHLPPTFLQRALITLHERWCYQNEQ